MARTSLVHYIAPSAISLTPNCNGSANDIAVYISRGAKIRVYSEAAGIPLNGSGYQEWTLTGRNRRLADSTAPYTIYARLSKADVSNGYLVFVKKQQVGGVWKDKYPYVIKDAPGLYMDVYGEESQDYYYIRLGDVSLPQDSKREITLDTGILGTPQYNEEWNENPDNLPLRVEIGCTVADEDAGPTPYVFWGQSLVLTSLLVKGWDNVGDARLDHWEIQRNADVGWPDQQRAEAFAQTGVITINHSRGSGDDFQGAVQTLFNITAWGYEDSDSSGSPVLVELGRESVCILAETIETFDLVKSSEYVNYNPMTGAYVPASGIDIGIRATDQKGDVFDVTVSQFSGMGLQLSYAPVGSEQWTPLTVSGQPQAVAMANIPVSVFHQKQSINVRLTRTVDGDTPGTTVTKELKRSTVAFVADGEDTNDREWIYKQDNATGYDSKTGTAHRQAVSGKTGDDWNADLTDDFVPTGWSDNALPVSAQHTDVYTSWRDYDREHDKWGDFQAPIQWSHWGEQGTDGDGVQYLYKLFDHELTDAERISNIPEDPVFNPTTKEWEATGWYDDPQAPTGEMPFCYCSIIQHIAGQWGAFQKLGMWSKWSEDGRDAALCYVERQAVFVPTDTSGVVLEDFQARVPFRVYAGNERLDVTDASIDEGSAAHYAHLFGGIMGITGSVASTKLSITGASVTGTKLMLGSKYVVGSSEVVIEVKKGVVLDEHMAALTVYARNSIGTEYTTYANIEILSNGIAKDGDTPLSVYKWSTSPDTPPAISGNDYPPAGWSKSAPDRPEGDSQYLWVSNTVKRGDGTVMDWGRPVRISGNDGSAGEDAKEREWIYKVSDTDPGTPENPEDRTIDDYVPAGWNDNPTGVTATARTEWASWRDFDHDTQLWGDFHAPVVWSHYGENGMDGDGVEYVFIRTTTNVAPTIVDSPDSREDSHGHTYLDDEYLPLATGGSLGSSQVECTDNPAGTSKNNPYEWVAKRTKGAADPITGKRTWEKFSGAMAGWANFSRNAIHLDLDNEMDMVSTDSAGKIEVARTIVTHATLYDGAQAGTTATLVSTAASLAIGGVTPTVSISGGVVTASWAFTRSNTLAAAATVSIVVQYDGVNRSVNFTVAPSLGEAILQLSPSMSSVPFGRDASGSLTPASRAVGLSITRIDGQSTTDYSTAAAAGVTVRYSKTAMPSSASAGTGWASGDITVDNTDTILYIAMFNSAGTLIDKETIPTVKDGKDGKSITKTGEAYRYATNNTGVRPAASSSDWSTTKPVLQKGYWLYTETTITWSDTSTTILYTDERNPNDGAAGQDIIVDGSTIMKYYVGTSNTTHPAEDSSDWKDLDQVTQEQGKWLWSQATTWYRKASSAAGAHDGGKSVNYNVSYISKDGKTGRGISSITEYYQATNSSAARQAPTSETGWDTDPNLSHLTDKWDQNHKYLWNMEKTVYTNIDGSSTTEYSIPQILAIWTKDGAPGKGIDSVQDYYKVTNSLTPPARTDTGWSTSPVAPTAENPYLYNYEAITWVNPASTTYTAVQMIGHYGRDGISVRAQYSVNKTSWHDTFAEGDEWMRTSTDNGTTWSTAMKIVGENGENGSETDFTFGISQYETTASAQTAPSDISTWNDAPMAVTDAKPYLWSKVQQKDGDGNVTSTRYIRLTGEQGDGTPVCILDRTAVFVPTDSTGKVLEPFSLVIPFRVQMGNAILAVKSASVSEEGSARYVSLHGGKLAGGYMSVSGTKVSLVGGVSGTKVSLSSSYVAGPSGVIVNVPKNVTLDEHLAGITVDVVDRRGVAYTAYGSFEILGKSMAKDGQNGDDGENAVNIIASPASVLVNQDLTNTDNLSNLSEVILFSAVKGGTQLSVTKVEITSTNHCAASGSDSNRATITAILKDGQVYYDNGDFVCSVRYSDGGTYKTVTGIKIKFYANLLGTWKETVDAGTRTIVAEKIEYEVDGGVLKNKTGYNYRNVSSAAMAYDQWTKDSVGTAGSYKYINKHLSDAEEDIDQLESVVGNAGSGLVQSVNTLTRTAEQTTSEITQIKTGKNMLKGALSGDSWYTEGTVPFDSHPGMTNPVIDDDGWFNVAASNQYYMITPGITLTKDKYYVLSVYSKTSSSFNVKIWKTASSASSWSPGATDPQTLTIPSGAQGTRRYVAFQFKGDTDTYVISFNVTTLRYPQLELGSTPTAFEVDSAKETSSSIKQAADTVTSNITDGLYNTGIDIENRKITIRSDKVDFKDSSGNDAKFSINSTDGSMKAEGGGTIGGFGIGTTTLGTSTPYNNSGYTYIRRDGKIDILNNSDADKGYDCGLKVYGGAQLNGAAQKPLYIRNMSGSNNITGHPLNLNTNANNGAYTYIGNPQSKVVVNAESTTFNDQVNLSEETNVGSNGVMTIQGILAMNSSVKTQSFTLPTNPKVGQVFFCKSMSSTLGDLIITAPSGSSIMASDSRTTNTSINIQDNSAFVVCMATDTWVLFRCN